MKIIEVLVSPEGQVSLQTKGFAGNSCREGSRFLEEALGNTLHERATAEFYQGQILARQSQQTQNLAEDHIP